MNLKVKEGRMVANERGLPIVLTEQEDFLQQAEFILSAPLGSFLYDKNFGSRIQEHESEDYPERLLAYANEALSAVSDMQALTAEKQGNEIQIEIDTGKGVGFVKLRIKEKNDDL